MQEELFKPSLTEENYKETKTYNISKLFYVAFFGGIVPMVVLGTKNALWLQIDKKKIVLMAVLGAAILISKIVLAGLVAAHQIEYDERTIRWVYRIACVLIYLGYHLLMKERFKQHLMTGGEVQPLLKDAIIWIIAGIVAELFLLNIVWGLAVYGW